MFETIVLAVLLGGVALSAVNNKRQEKREKERRRKQEEEWRKQREDLQRQAREEREEEERRRATPPMYTDGVSQDEFERIVSDVAGQLPRIRSLMFEGFVIRICVTSNSGLSDWVALIDFNDYGHLTGWYVIRSDNDQSPIPQTIGERVRERLEARLKSTANN